jgi:AraC family transcriptional regulator of adaptative response / DNA-3-methyladenine glycosylase II
MELDDKICYRAVSSRDRRFDGRFFTAVLSTGIYCRPICPARTPREKNCRFFRCAAAAEEAGFRACLRCRPEASPHTPAWLGTSATVSRALRLISEGALDEAGVDALARRLGVGDRHLRRLFNLHVGASPRSVALTRRIHLAKKLIDETGLSFADIAFSAGFNSIRRFNAAIRKSYGRSPTDLRRSRGEGTRRSEPQGCLSLRLAFRPPYSWRSLAGFMAPRAIPGVETVDSRGYRRTLALGEAQGVIEVRPSSTGSQLVLTLPNGFSPHLALIVERIRDLFDLGAVPEIINRHLRQDPQLAGRVKANPGLRVPGAFDRFELMVRAVLGQQITVQGATRMAGKLVQAFGRPLAGHGPEDTGRLFPGPEILAEADVAGIGMPAQRGETIRNLARAMINGRLRLDAPADLEEVTDRLMEIPGVGPWTAHYVAMRAFKEPDAFPEGDLGLRRALARGDKPLAPKELAEKAKAWRPWRAYAAMHLWMHGPVQK